MSKECVGLLIHHFGTHTTILWRMSETARVGRDARELRVAASCEGNDDSISGIRRKAPVNGTPSRKENEMHTTCAECVVTVENVVGGRRSLVCLGNIL